MLKNQWLMKIVVAVLGVVAAFGASYYWFFGQTISTGVEKAPNKVNVLVLGVDERSGDVGRSDTMFVLTADTKTKQVSMLSVPRDTRVKIPGHGWDKINHAYANGGHKLSQKSVEDLLGIKMDHYVLINFAGFFKIVDALDGIDIDVEKRMHYEDPYDNLVIDLKPGMQHLDSKKAIQYVRYRDEEGDLGRVRRQQHFIKAVYEKVLSPSVIPHIPALIREVSSAVKTDLSVTDMISLAKMFNDAFKEGLKADIVPGKPAYIDDISYWLPDVMALREHVAQMQNLHVNDKYAASAKQLAQEYERSIPREMKVIEVPKQVQKPQDIKKPQQPKKPQQTNKPSKNAPEAVKVDILNASGKDDAGTKMANMLKSRGFEIQSVSNAAPTARTVIVSHTTSGSVVNKLTGLPFPYSLQITKSENSNASVTVVIGKDFK